MNSQNRMNGIFMQNSLIIQLNDTNYDNMTLNGLGNNNWLIMFYVQNCKNCYDLLMNLNETSEVVKNDLLEVKRKMKNESQFGNLRIGMVDCH